MGLAFLAKGTILLLVGPAAAILLVMSWRSRRSRGTSPTGSPDGATGGHKVVRAVVALGVAALSALAVTGVFLAQNDAATGSPLGVTADSSVVSGPVTAAVAPNALRALAANYDIGNGTSGPETAVSRAVLALLHHAYDVFGVAQDDRRYNATPGATPFRVVDDSLTTRQPNYGDNPWHISLALVALLLLAWWVARGRRWARAPCALGAALVVGFVLFYALAKWSPFNVRYEAVTVVALASVTATVLSRFPRVVATVLLATLVVACLPQVVDNTDTPLVHRITYRDALAPYFIEGYAGAATQTAQGYESIAAAVRQSGCSEIAIGNWILKEYPLWVALRRVGWTGHIGEIDVKNATKRYELRRMPCGEVLQVDPLSTRPDGDVVYDGAGLDLLLDPSMAQQVTVAQPGFSSTVPGVRLLQGENWTIYEGATVLLGSGSVFVASARDAQVRLSIHLLPGRAPPPLSVSVAGGPPVPMRSAAGEYWADLTVRPGVTRVLVTLGDAPSTGDAADRASFWGASLAPAATS